MCQNIDNYEKIKTKYFILDEVSDYVLIKDEFPLFDFNPQELRALLKRIFEDHAILWEVPEPENALQEK